MSRDPSINIANLIEQLSKIPQELSSKDRSDIILQHCKDLRLLSIVVPKSFGGEEYALKDVVKLVFSISKTSASAGLIYAMHLSQLLCLVRHGNTTFLQECLQKLSDEQGLIASVTSEIRVGGDIFGSQCHILEKGDALLLEKSTPNISYADTAGAFLITAMDLRIKKPTQRLIYVLKEQAELVVLHRNSFLGMQGISNGSYKIQANFSEDAIFSDNFPLIARETMTPTTHILWAALWSGIASHVIEVCRRFISKELESNSNIQQYMSFKLSELVNLHHTMNSLIRDSLHTWESSKSSSIGFSAAAQYNRLKIICSETLNGICYQALNICGLRGYAEDGPYSLAEAIRDALSAPLMVSNYRLMQNTLAVEKFVQEEP
ncbi:MAG: hypothetical protein R2880_04365 [Deinococcales bacterium]